MPCKFNESRRPKIPKVTNWPEYNAALVKRGNFARPRPSRPARINEE
jgi:hypothetical protein